MFLSLSKIRGILIKRAHWKKIVPTFNPGRYSHLEITMYLYLIPLTSPVKIDKVAVRRFQNRFYVQEGKNIY